MSKIYQKIYLTSKSCSKGVLGGFIDNVILRSFYSESRPLFFKRAGFTLIELLVVVLIIAILASIALPQYQRAVDKTKLVQAIQMAEEVARSQEIYWLANGVYSHGPRNLDISYPECTMSTDDHEGQIKCKDWFIVVDNGWRGAAHVMFCPGKGQQNCDNVPGTNGYRALKMSFTIFYNHSQDYFAVNAGKRKSSCNSSKYKHLCTFFDGLYK